FLHWLGNRADSLITWQVSAIAPYRQPPNCVLTEGLRSNGKAHRTQIASRT
ncbi:MAG: hypothetical protein ICV85_07230, partial [Tolypothrix sp. T3-bin4]|nr:hypothetical protein [Tolypothrix sp. T3-bin4]